MLRVDSPLTVVLSYLKTMNLRIGLLMNFDTEVLKDGLRRVVN